MSKVAVDVEEGGIQLNSGGGKLLLPAITPAPVQTKGKSIGNDAQKQSNQGAAVAGATSTNAIENQGSVAPIQLQDNDVQKQSDQGAGVVGGGGVDNTIKPIAKLESQPSKLGMTGMKNGYLRTKDAFNNFRTKHAVRFNDYRRKHNRKQTVERAFKAFKQRIYEVFVDLLSFLEHLSFYSCPVFPDKKHSQYRILSVHFLLQEKEEKGKIPFMRRMGIHFHDFLFNSAPKELGGIDTKELPSYIGLPFVLLYFCMYGVILFYLAVTGSVRSFNNKFLSLDVEAGVCFEVPLPITAVFSADYYGHWETDPLFQKNATFFQLDLKGSLLTNDQYQKVMTNFSSKLAELGSKAAKRNIWYTTMVQSSFQFSNTEYGMLFYTNVDAGIITSSASVFYDWAWHNRAGFCNKTGSDAVHPSFDDGRWLTLNIPLTLPVTTTSNYWAYNQYNQPNLYQPCPAQGDIRRFTYSVNKAYSPTNNAYVRFDVRTINTVIALNTGVVDLSQLMETKSVFSKFAVYGYPGSFYIDSFYAPMDPIFCINMTSPVYSLTTIQQQGPPICFAASENTGAQNVMLYYPFADVVKNIKAGQPYTSCLCPQDKYLRYCNQLIPVYNMFHRTDVIHKNATLYTIEFGIRMQQFMLSDPDNGDIRMMQYMTGVSSAMLEAFPVLGYLPNKPLASLFPTTNVSYANGLSILGVLKREWDKICPDQLCSSFQFATYSGSSGNLFEAVNPFNVQLGFLSNETYLDTTYGNAPVPVQTCIDTITQPNAMKKLSSKPPVPLVEKYYQCHLPLASAVEAAIGVAASQASLYAFVAISIISIFTVFFINQCHNYYEKNVEPAIPSNADKLMVNVAVTHHRHHRTVYALADILKVVDDLREFTKNPSIFDGQQIDADINKLKIDLDELLNLVDAEEIQNLANADSEKRNIMLQLQKEVNDVAPDKE